MTWIKEVIKPDRYEQTVINQPNDKQTEMFWANK